VYYPDTQILRYSDTQILRYSDTQIPDSPVNRRRCSNSYIQTSKRGLQKIINLKQGQHIVEIIKRVVWLFKKRNKIKELEKRLDDNGSTNQNYVFLYFGIEAAQVYI
jgi:hypothetical protein